MYFLRLRTTSTLSSFGIRLAPLMRGSVGDSEETDTLTIPSKWIELKAMMGGRSDGVAFEEEEDDAEHGVDGTEELSKVKTAQC